MSDYIDIYAAVAIVNKYSNSQSNVEDVTADIINELFTAPAADVIEVVRCKDCIWFEPDSVWEKGKKIRYRKEGEFVSAEEGVNVQSYCECPRYRHLDGLMFVTKEHYCAHAERREDE